MASLLDIGTNPYLVIDISLLPTSKKNVARSEH